MLLVSLFCDCFRAWFYTGSDSHTCTQTVNWLIKISQASYTFHPDHIKAVSMLFKILSVCL